MLLCEVASLRSTRQIPNPKYQITKQKKVEKNNCRKTFYIKLFTALSKNILPENGKTLRLGNLFYYYFFVFKNCAKSVFTSYIRKFGKNLKGRNNKNH
jgi:hypothetical protein